MNTFIKQAKKLIGLTLIASPFVWLWVMGVVELGVWETLEVSRKYGVVMVVGFITVVGVHFTFKDMK